MASRSARLSAMLLLLCVSQALAIRAPEESRSLLATAAPEPTAPVGWWQSIRMVTPNKTVYCGLRDFPPIGGEGPSRMLCGGETAAFSPLWVWKATKPSSNTSIQYGDAFNLRIFNQMKTYCRTTGGGQVQCGVGSLAASSFTLEKVGADATGQDVDFNQDSLYLKSGGKYCQLSGKGNSSYIFCKASSAAAATVFQMPYSHYYPVSLTSQLTNIKCGATFIPITAELPPVNCNTVSQPNFYSNVVLSLQTPGTGLVSGGAAAFTTFDQLWHYQDAAWSADSAQVVSVNNDMTGAKIFFTIEKPGSAAGTPIAAGDTVAIKSVKQDKYCGIASGAASMSCTVSAGTPILGTTLYLFTINLS